VKVDGGIMEHQILNSDEIPFQQKRRASLSEVDPALHTGCYTIVAVHALVEASYRLRCRIERRVYVRPGEGLEQLLTVVSN
jgi:hypothetical protein